MALDGLPRRVYATEQHDARISTGISGLESPSRQGLAAQARLPGRRRPGQRQDDFGPSVFSVTGVARGENVLYVTLSETRSELAAVAASMDGASTGWPIHELAPA